MKDQKPWPGSSCNQDFAHGRGLEPKVKMSELGDALTSVSEAYCRLGFGDSAPAAA